MAGNSRSGVVGGRRWISAVVAVALFVAGLMVTGTGPAEAAEGGSILVSIDDRILEYTPSGVLLRQLPVPYPTGARPGTEWARDLVLDESALLHVYNGTFDPFLSSYDFSTDQWRHDTHEGFSTVNNGSYGGIATFGRSVFLSDMRTFGDVADQLSGIVMFDTLDGSSLRFSDGIEYIDLTAGLDGLLYGLDYDERTVNVFDPASRALVRTLTLARDVRGLAVDASGQLFGASLDDNLYRFSASGSLVTTRPSGTYDLLDVDVSSTGQLIAGARFGEVILSDTSLSSLTLFDAGDDGAFVAFAAAGSVPSGPPGPPTNVTAQPWNQAAFVSWAAPFATGGAVITGYTATASSGGASCTTTSLSCVIPGLANGVTYTVVVRATNVNGAGPGSSPPVPVTPRTVPTAPSVTSIVPGPGEVTVTWAAPLDDGGAAITSYTVSAPGAATVTVDGSARSVTVTGLANGASYYFQVIATNAAGDSPAPPAAVAVTPIAFEALPAPARLLDTRNEPTVDGRSSNLGPLPAGATFEVVVAGRGGLAGTATSVALNVTAVNPGGIGFVTVFPCGQARPTASNLNFQAGDVLANAVVTRVGTEGKVCLYTSAPTHLIVDASGAFLPGAFSALPAPARLLDTRNEPTTDGQSSNLGALPAGSFLELAVAGRGGLAGSTASVALNVTSVNPAAAGFVTVFPCGQPRPTASNLNFLAGDVRANAVIAAVGNTGTVCLYTSASTHLVVDASGAFSPGGFAGLPAPARLLDTRNEPTFDGQYSNQGQLPGGVFLALQVAGRGGLAASAGTVALNVTAVHPVDGGFLTVFPCGRPMLTTSNLNFAPGDVLANSVIAKLGRDGRVCIYTSATTHLVLDAAGTL